MSLPVLSWGPHMNQNTTFRHLLSLYWSFSVFLPLSLFFTLTCTHKHIHLLIADLFSVQHYKVNCFSSLFLKCLFHLSGSAKAITVFASFLPSTLFFPLFFFHSVHITFGPLELGTCKSYKKLQIRRFKQSFLCNSLQKAWTVK